MIQVSERHFRRTENAMVDARCWADRHPHSELVGWYHAHANALAAILDEMEVKGPMTAQQELDSVRQFAARLEEIKAAATNKNNG